MKNRKELLILIVLVMGGILLLTGFLFSSAYAQKAIEWRMMTSWGTEYIHVRKLFLPFVERVNQRAAGRLKISWVGPEAVPSLEQFKPLREGLFDALFTTPGYHFGEIQVGQAQDITIATGKERRSSGMVKILDEAYRKKTNIVYLSGIPDGTGYHLMLKKKIDRADLTGLKIRTSPYYDPLVKALHGIPVRVAPAEIYSALEKGVVDGAGWPFFGALDYKWYEVVKYMVRPRFGDDVYQILVNLNSWNRLPKDLQNLLTNIAIEMENEGAVTMQALYESEERELLKRGMELLVLPPKEAQKYLTTFHDRSWEELVLTRDSEFGPRLKAAADGVKKK